MIVITGPDPVIHHCSKGWIAGSSPAMTVYGSVQFSLRPIPHYSPRTMLKLITILAALIPVILFLKNVFFRRSKVMQHASAEFRKQVDYLVWGILFLIGCGIVYSIGRLIYSFWG
jgi:hypothetical protein